ncbi:glutathione S-transferase A2-like [Mus caroli]|uniref:glutathione transferase n=1 Tax=Mus caroli TaxID=10089 RepID=A0A6P7R7R0_MUSCR|nr:glutathione S-transferase A2-like [Mus caroli]
MAGKPVLHYFNARGRMECIRWLLAAAGVEFEEKFIQSPEDLEKLKKDGNLMFEQVPMVEIDGMKLVQTRAILNYIATKYDLYGKDMKERALYVFLVFSPVGNKGRIWVPLSGSKRVAEFVSMVVLGIKHLGQGWQILYRGGKSRLDGFRRVRLQQGMMLKAQHRYPAATMRGHSS